MKCAQLFTVRKTEDDGHTIYMVLGLVEVFEQPVENNTADEAGTSASNY